MSSRLREIASSALGFHMPFADVHICADADGGAPYQYWEQWSHGNQNHFHTDIETALALMTTGRNDCLLLTPDSHTQGDGIDWSGNMCHFIGMFPPAFRYQRSRIGHNANFATLLDVSGYGNLLANLHLMYGRGNATNLNALTISGEGNTLINCNVACYNATELDTSGFDLVRINAGEGYIKDCNFGADSVATGATDLLRIYGPSDRSCRFVFENCTFLMNADAGADANFIEFVAGAGEGIVQFLNCRFLNTGTSLTYAIDGTGLGNQMVFFDSRCTFVGVTDIVAAAYENYVWFGGINVPVGQSASGDLVALFNGLACHPDAA
jgi:hypothetical protein